MKPDYRRMDRKARELLLRITEEGSGCDILMTDDDWAFLDQLRAIPKPGNPNLPKTGGKRPGAGRKKKITDTAK